MRGTHRNIGAVAITISVETPEQRDPMPGRNMMLLLPMMLTLARAADEMATTEDGTGVVLHDDGTWKKAPNLAKSGPGQAG